MPARLVQVTILNNSDYPIVWQDDGRDHLSAWQKPWYPSNIKNLTKGQRASFRIESDGVMQGAGGWAYFKIDVPFASNVGDRTEYFTLRFSRSYIGGFKWNIDPPQSDNGPVLAFVRDLGFGEMANIDSSPYEFVPAIPFAPFTGPVFLNDDANAKHVAWVVEVRNVEESTSTLPLQLATKVIVYGVTPRVEATSDHFGRGATLPSGGDLLWFRHDGRLDGSFQWEGPETVGTRWDAFRHVFSGGDDIVYGVTPRVDTALSDHVGGDTILASGGDLMWYRHIGREDGSFRWDGPRRVGTRWDVFKHVFSGGNGIIYAIQENGDLLWYRHVGRGDGSFVWQGPKKVGIGWGELSQVFSSGDGIVYGVTPRVEATSDHFGRGATLPSGGDLLWFRHVGREDGSFDWNGPKKVGTRWDAFSTVFSGGDDIIYGVTPRVDTALSDHVGGDTILASGGDLMWYRHIGREDGSFRWESPKRVGTGWGKLPQVFSGGVLLP